MAYYDLTKAERQARSAEIYADIISGTRACSTAPFIGHFSDEDTYIRKAAYLSTGRIWLAEPQLQQPILTLLEQLYLSTDAKIRQTVINAAGEGGKYHFGRYSTFLTGGFLIRITAYAMR
jgi:hypothetical protein